MQKVNSSRVIPAQSIVSNALSEIHYSDAFYIFFTSKRNLSIDYFFKEFSNISPGWVRGLLRLRNFLVRFIGLKHDYPEVPVAKDQRIEAGCKVGMFNIVQRNENEIVFGEDDKHLEFRSSLLLDPQNDKHVIYSITIVHFHNITGKIYFFFVKPFHRSIVKSFMKQLIKRAQEA